MQATRQERQASAHASRASSHYRADRIGRHSRRAHLHAGLQTASHAFK